ncbi:hypothetical protein ACFY71_39980 [Streptomyces cinerochromogenes]|uniref:hypothetical protein n=1 Tax=Streptomyces cinerochromogenes TaxID=66422 RepID=UPI0036A70ECC
MRDEHPPRQDAVDQDAMIQNSVDQDALEKRRLAQETKNERQVWYFLAYFLFGIHFVAFIMIYAVRHAK